MNYEPKGLYLEEFEIGKVYISQARTITEADVINFAGISGDFNVLHTNEEFAKSGPFKERVAHGMLGASVMTGLSNMLGIFDGTTIAFLELTIRYKNPLRIYDTVHLEVETLDKHDTSKPGRGIVNFMARLVNQKGVIIIESPWTIMMKSGK
ncbi:MAG: MaoC/PaaZ C-terminal domain-containing protein [Peptoniphilus sp.]|nr:MaoC/PaaZ C-terminal domain-containing protein [Peptoniphilus sp.]MDD7363472.1 MaoC/PaaZ C-terminal domain-containing protein [Bacillota bacterium]MDY6044824.1 MaoC/PaaZ C-terminal domain-containing protein [Peptoniphilus sp.]